MEKGSPDNEDREPPADAPWPVRRGGWVLKLYENSLGLAFLLLFLASICLHALGGSRLYSEEQVAHGKAALGFLGYLGTAHFWFESLQNWQSEFLAISSMVILSIFLRQCGSSQSNPVSAPHRETGTRAGRGRRANDAFGFAARGDFERTDGPPGQPFPESILVAPACPEGGVGG